MCELFAMSSRELANASFSLEEFSKHGGLTNHHKDGWGIVYYRENDAQVIREPVPAYNSAQLQFVKNRKLESNMIISHIRKATMGEIALRNTQPFNRELAGDINTFAHNGMCPDIISHSLKAGPYHPIGDTDSEHAFCYLLKQMAQLYVQSAEVHNKEPSLDAKLELISQFANHIRPMGPANFIYSDSGYIFCHSDRRKHKEGMSPPGLYVLCRSCKTEPRPVQIPGLSIVTVAKSQDIVLVASVPLSDEDWQPISQGDILVLHKGQIVKRHNTITNSTILTD
ncbi:MAG: class II glutamine amidotransferase [Pseudomonadales bacterium]|nr:class II glutamine amidotransferase [Pseudomonadales bacterium]